MKNLSDNLVTLLPGILDKLTPEEKKEMLILLEEYGFKEIKPESERQVRNNPDLFEIVEEKIVPSGYIKQEIRTGWRYKDGRVIRPARVIVQE